MDELNRKQWEMKAVTRGIAEFEETIKLLEGKCQALELIHASQQPRNTNSNCSTSKQTEHTYVATYKPCVMCIKATIPCIDVSSSRKQAHVRG